MEANGILRRVVGAIRNAVVWGGAWFTLAATVALPMRLADDVSPLIAVADAMFIGARVGFIGGVAGAAFAGLISVFYRGRRLSEISALRFGLGGAILAGAFVPTVLLAGNLITGDGFAVLPYILDDTLMAAVFGGVTAAGSITLAQRSDVRYAGVQRGQLEPPARVDSPGGAYAERAADPRPAEQA